jgi:hypothetical protein
MRRSHPAIPTTSPTHPRPHRTRRARQCRYYAPRRRHILAIAMISVLSHGPWNCAKEQSSPSSCMLAQEALQSRTATIWSLHLRTALAISPEDFALIPDSQILRAGNSRDARATRPQMTVQLSSSHAATPHQCRRRPQPTSCFKSNQRAPACCPPAVAPRLQTGALAVPVLNPEVLAADWVESGVGVGGATMDRITGCLAG